MITLQQIVIMNDDFIHGQKQCDLMLVVIQQTVYKQKIQLSRYVDNYEHDGLYQQMYSLQL